MTESPAESSYRVLARLPRYGHYARIPARVCRCLEHFGATFDGRAVAERLLAYYLFIGVADDAIDSRGVEAGREILRRLAEDDDGPRAVSALALATGELRRHVAPEARARVFALLEELAGAVVGERRAASVAAYIEERRRVGRLTAEVSYVLVEPLVAGGGDALRGFLARVGEVGCLVDSLVDFRADARAGAFGFAPNARGRLRLARRTIADGARLLFARPRLAPLFFAAVVDVVRDRRARAGASEESETLAGASLVGELDTFRAG
ncbi:MAG TPA: hypothetical protein VFX96_11855 [Pyrinomonadaceae bacterium]|nr:hypothetical protein [Pyrinomonadaceae bacterium]